MRTGCAASLILLAASFSAAVFAAGVPYWGAHESSSVDTPPSQLKPGEWIWGGDNKAMGPMAVVVSLTEQRAYIYRNGILIAVSTVSTGKPGHETPTGVFTILQKDKDHHSNLYNNAPMPYQQRLTMGGVALHAGGLPGYPESHGCVHLPTEFARLLFESSNMGMTVVITEEGEAPVNMVHPSFLMPIDAHTGAELEVPPFAEGEDYRWQPELSPNGPVSMVMSRSDRRLIVYRNGVEIGRTRVDFRHPGAIVGTHAYIAGQGYVGDEVPGNPRIRMPNWFAIGPPGHEDEAHQPVSQKTIDDLVIPPQFVALLVPLMQPGTVLVATDAPISPQTSGGETRTVIDSNPPG